LFNGEGLMIHAEIILFYAIFLVIYGLIFIYEKSYCNKVSFNFDVNGSYEETDEWNVKKTFFLVYSDAAWRVFAQSNIIAPNIKNMSNKHWQNKTVH